MRYRVLTVDDSKTVRMIVKKALKRYDCDLLEASNGVEGLALSFEKNPDLILLDVTMPVMDGVEMLTKLKSDAALKIIPVIMLTAEIGRDHLLKIARIGVRDYIVKPFNEELLIEKCSRVIGLEAKTTNAVNVDASTGYYTFEGDVMIMRLPEICSSVAMAEAALYLQPKLGEAVATGISKVVIDIHFLTSLHAGVIKLLLQAMQTCRDMRMRFALVGSPQIIAACKGFEAARAWTFFDSSHEAKSNFSQISAPQLAGTLS